MEALLIAGVALVVGYGAFRYYRAFLEARDYREIDAAWGAANRERAQAAYRKLSERGLRVKLKTIGAPDLTRMLPQRLTSVRVHRDDYAEAAHILSTQERD